MIAPALSPGAKRRARWAAAWALLKGAEALIGHLADLAKKRATAPEGGE